MRFLRVSEAGRERPALLDAGGVTRDLSAVVDDLADASLGPDRLAALARLDASSLPALDPGERIDPSVGRLGHFICVGLNYADHAAETGAELPASPSSSAMRPRP